MSSSIQELAAIDADPFRIGIRYVRHKDADGTERIEQFPLKQEDLLFPQEGDQVFNVDAHYRVLQYLFMMLCHHLRTQTEW